MRRVCPFRCRAFLCGHGVFLARYDYADRQRQRTALHCHCHADRTSHPFRHFLDCAGFAASFKDFSGRCTDVHPLFYGDLCSVGDSADTRAACPDCTSLLCNRRGALIPRGNRQHLLFGITNGFALLTAAIGFYSIEKRPVIRWTEPVKTDNRQNAPCVGK